MTAQTPQKFRPERPIYLNEQNTNFRTKEEVLLAIERLRAMKPGRGWLVAYGEKSRPFHMSFNRPEEFQEFKRACKEESVKLHSPVIAPDDLEEFEAKENEGQAMPDATANSSVEDVSGRIHIGG